MSPDLSRSTWIDDLVNKNLLVDAVYRGGRSGNASDDPLPHLVGVSNQGGFRYIGTKGAPRLVVLTCTPDNVDWPDGLDKDTGLFTYFGDNRTPGRELHDTPRFGNRLLRDMFENAHGTRDQRRIVPPILVFTNSGPGNWRDSQFLGLAVPGAVNVDSNNDLVAVWKMRDGKRFQNYKATLTILDEPEIDRSWIENVKIGKIDRAHTPQAWCDWAETGTYRALRAARVVEHRGREEQLPDGRGRELIALIQAYFHDSPTRFEACAARLAQMMLPAISNIDLTRPSRDGGRDAIGKYRIGHGASSITLDFALEAKCYDRGNSVGVRELSRLISRLRHRQFGVLVTTSYVANQAYKEIKEDEHPVVIISAVDIVRILDNAGLNSTASLGVWLAQF